MDLLAGCGEDERRSAEERGSQKGRLRTNGVDTNGVAAKVMKFDRLGKRYAKITDFDRLVPKLSLCQNIQFAVTPLVLTPFVPFRKGRHRLNGYSAQGVPSLLLAGSLRSCVSCAVLRWMFPWRTRYPLSRCQRGFRPVHRLRLRGNHLSNTTCLTLLVQHYLFNTTCLTPLV